MDIATLYHIRLYSKETLSILIYLNVYILNDVYDM